MLTQSQQTDLNNFNEAKKIALSIGENQYRRASANKENPFYGANLRGMGTIVIWKPEDQKFTKAVKGGRIELDKQVFNFRKVAEYTILEG